MTFPQRARHYATHIAVGVAALLAGAAGVAWAAPAAPTAVMAAVPQAQNCTIVQGAAADQWTLTCTITGLVTPGAPSPSPSPSTSPSASPSPSTSPSASQTPSPSPTTTSPSPSPSTTRTGPRTNCLNNLAACGFPHAGNTGVPAGTLLTVVNGNVTLSTAGQVYENKDVRGCIRITAPNVTIRNTRITCGGIEAGGSYTRVDNRSFGFTITDSEVNCGDNYGSGIGSDSFTAIRVNVNHCENGFNVGSPGNVILRDSYVHDLWAGGTAHADGMQWGEGASNIRIEHNVIYNDNTQTAAIIMWDEGGAQNNNVLITQNLLAGGGHTLYCGRVGTSTNVVISNNRFAAWAFSPANSCYGSHVTTWSNNVNDSTGLPFNAPTT